MRWIRQRLLHLVLNVAAVCALAGTVVMQKKGLGVPP